MAIKLRLVLKNQIFQLASKALFFGLFLHLLVLGGGVVAASFFMVIVVWLYVRPLFNTSLLLSSFSVLLFLSFWIIDDLSYISSLPFPYVHWMIIAIVSFLFFLILGLKNLIFIRRKIFFIFLHCALVYMTLINFFLIDKSSFFLGKWLLFVLIFYLLFYEFFFILARGARDRIAFVSAICAVGIGEMMWIVSWLPLGFLNSSNLLMTTVLLIEDITTHHYRSMLTRNIVVKDFFIYGVLMAVIFATSTWSISP